MQRTLTDKEKFMKKVIVLVDTREQQNDHIIQTLNSMGVQHQSCKLDFGDYSFLLDGKDFRQSCVIERKGSVDELYGNVTQDLPRIEKELLSAKIVAGGCTMLIEGVTTELELKKYTIPHAQVIHQGRKVQDIGRIVYPVLQSFKAASRYSVSPEYTLKENSAQKILEIFYYYYRGYDKLIAPRKDKERSQKNAK